MKKFNLAKLLSLVLVFTLLMGTFAVLPASAAEAPSIKFVSNNVFFGEKIHLMYAVETANAPAGAKVVVTVSDGTNTYATEEKSDATYGTVYVSKSGVAAQNIATVYTATATLMNGDTVVATATQTYSVLEYLYTRLLVSTEKTEAQVAMYNSLLDYAAKAEAVLCAERETKVNDYVLVTAKDATVNGETSLIVKKGTKVTPVLDAGFTVPSGKALVWNVTPYGGATVTYTAEEAAQGIAVNGSVNIEAGLIEGSVDDNAIKTYEYTFVAGAITYGTPVDLGDATWTVTGDSTYIGNLDSTKGLQLGKGTEAHTALTFTSADRFGDVTKIVINTSGASSTNAKLTVTVGGAQIGETVSLTSTAAEYEFTSTTPLNGVIVLSYTQTSEKAIYIKSMAVNPVVVEEPEPEEPENPGVGGSATTYKYEFTASQFTANGTKTLGDVDWTLAGDGGYWGYDGTKGQHLGSGSKPYKSLTFTSEELNGVTKIVINTSGGSSVNATLTVTVGGTQIGDSVKITATASTYTFESDVPLDGEVVFTYTQSSSKALYIKSIEISYTKED